MAQQRHHNVELKGPCPSNGLSPNFPETSETRLESIRAKNLRYSIWTRNHEIRSIGSGDPEPNVPGLGTKGDEFPIYIEAKDGEGPLLLGRRLARYLKARINSGLLMPDGGGIRGSGWQVRLPDDAIFTCKFLSGYHYSASRMSRVSQERRIEVWKPIISDFANETHRRTGVIESQVFIVSDGSTFPMKLCESRRARDEEG